ncbi:dienelactone hydrolase family protein [Longimicrobium sp.]
MYPGAGHAFANPSGQAYKADVAGDAWVRTTSHFGQHLR